METEEPMVRVEAAEWNSPAADEARRIRMTVFVGEQKVPAEMEIDAIDPGAHHVVAYNGDGEAVGTGRLFTDPKDEACGHIGRMAVAASARGRGVGARMLEALIAESRRRGYRRIVLSSQSHAMGFYAKHGFRAFGGEYMDAGIPHRDMELMIGEEAGR
ncbi:GNAT family N-acetyltransferase [Candidatus Poribacteria bacterium]|nr:GNAT family N-acetyltransferase [Candidatus Poribacteria bacterium]